MASTPIDVALRGASPEPLWLDAGRPARLPALNGVHQTHLAVVGGGYTGLWTALLAKQRHPERRVVLLEAEQLGWAASGRNGGFVNATLTHGRANGELHVPDEVDQLDRLGLENLDQLEKTARDLGWDCEFERSGNLAVATEPYQVDEIREAPGFLTGEEVRQQVHSPTYLGGILDTASAALVNPAKLVWSLRSECLGLGVEIMENSRVTGLERAGGGVRIRTTAGVLDADQVALATNVFPSLLRRYRMHTIPVYDYVLATEPLTTEQMASIGWTGRQGIDDLGNQFHYYRLTADNRVVFGGYDAIYHFGRSIRPEFDQRPETFRTLARHFFETFPQLEEVRFSHAWGGVIDTSTRFFPFFGRGFGGRVAYAAGFTGLGVAYSRFAGLVMLDLLSGGRTELTELRMVRRRPLPFPPEPLAWAGVELTRRSLAAADRRQGRRNRWLKALDKLHLGFDS